MLEILGYISVTLLLAIVAILAFASKKPDQFQFARTTRISAPPERLYALINDLRQMNTWNPYALREKAGTTTYSGPANGKGARFDFAGKKSGTGHIEILDTIAPSNVVMRLFMTKPMNADNRVDFKLQPDGSATNVTWAMSGRQPLLAKVVTMFINCDKMVGKDFEEGLANLKVIAEKA